jgi:hypothetical protein
MLKNLKDSDTVDVYLINQEIIVVAGHKDTYFKLCDMKLVEISFAQVLEIISKNSINPYPLEMSFEEFKEMFM